MKPDEGALRNTELYTFGSFIKQNNYYQDMITSIFETKKNATPVMTIVITMVAQTSIPYGLVSEKNLGLTVGRGLANVKKSLS